MVLLDEMLKGARPRALLHVGSSYGQELRKYLAAAVQEVVWVDALPDCVVSLREHLKRKSLDVSHRVLQGLVSDREGVTIEYHVASNRGQSSSMYTPKLHVSAFPRIKFTHTVTMRTTTLENLLETHGVTTSFDVLVIDVQGAELPALRGFPDDRWSSLNVLFSEISYQEYYEGGTEGEKLRDYLNAKGLELWKQDAEVGHGNAIFVRPTFLRTFAQRVSR